MEDDLRSVRRTHQEQVSENEPEPGAMLYKRRTSVSDMKTSTMPWLVRLTSSNILAVSMLDLKENLMAVILWFGMLNFQFGKKMLLLIHISQHLVKGVVYQFQTLTMIWLLQEYKVDGPSLRTFTCIATSMWSLKPVLGCMSDVLPVHGHRKKTYAMLTSVLGVACTLAIGLTSSDSLSPAGVVVFLCGMTLQAVTCDLLTEACYSEQIKKKPEYGPDLVVYAWGGVSVGSMFAAGLAGWIIANLSARAVFLVCIAPSALIIPAAATNMFEEMPLSSIAVSKLQTTFLQQPEIIYLCALVTGTSLSLSTFSVLVESQSTKCIAAVVAIAGIIISSHFILRPDIFKVITYFALQACFGVSISSASFLFYSDQPLQYPEGPHFSIAFLSFVLCFATSAMSLVGLVFYLKCMKSWSFRQVLAFGTVLLTLLPMLFETIMFLGINVSLGIPDWFLLLGSSISTVIARQWQWLPGILLVSYICPSGMEATMLGLLAGCAHVGTQVSNHVGASLLNWLEVNPKGSAAESREFNHLWQASLLANLISVCSIVLIPILIPDVKQLDIASCIKGNCSATRHHMSKQASQAADS
eukprot:TRINITY_DN14311_c0_g1_i1.p1 TRINITY_DN14311_c0_g1~~TRINITY_DN14311_c0_g1_i1.p1  ORF type:complete len:584 (+),score=85.55 TRINITY_DN14311_c0_g1_i1:234-1985(+)